MTNDNRPNNRDEGINYCLSCEKLVIILLTANQNHSQFQNFVSSQIKQLFLSGGSINLVLLFHRELASVWHTDLSKVRSIVKHCYSQDKGRCATDPVNLFRSLLLMELRHVLSVDQWVNDLRTQPILAILSGFEPGNTPGVGTFYDFQNRLWSGVNAHLSKKVRKPRRKPKKGKKKGDKAPMRKPGVVKRLVKRFLKYPPSFKNRPSDLLQQILKECFVLPSAKMGLLGNTSMLSVAGDGTSVRTGANPYGKTLCKCRENRIFRCDCARRFSDPDADWGWDSYREQYFYGRSLYAFTASDSPYDLPIYLSLHKASRHDSVAFVISFFEMLKLYPQFSFDKCILDSAHDAYPIYQLLHHYDMAALIDLNPRAKGHPTYAGDISFNKVGIPVCLANHIMTYSWYDKERMRHKWRCPKTRKRWNVKCVSPCSSSAYGRTFYTREEDNLRYFPRFPRGSKQWKLHYKRRTTVERSFKRLKEDYLLERRGKIRSSRAWHFRSFTSAMCLHVDAWIKHESIDLRPLVYQWQKDALRSVA